MFQWVPKYPPTDNPASIPANRLDPANQLTEVTDEHIARSVVFDVLLRREISLADIITLQPTTQPPIPYRIQISSVYMLSSLRWFDVLRKPTSRTILLSEITMVKAT